MKLPESSIQEINEAIKITRSNNFKVQLLCRKVECLAFLDLLEAGRTLEKLKMHSVELLKMVEKY